MSDLPDQWVDVALSEIAEINPPHADRPIENDQMVSFVPMALVSEESGTLDASQVRPWKEVSKSYTRFQEGDILFAKITPCMENGKFALASGLSGGVGAGSTEFHVLRARPGIRSKYLLHFLFQGEVRRSARMEMKGAAGQLRVPTSFLEKLRIPVAPPEEQDRIVAELERQFTRLDAATTALKRVQANLKRYRASVLKQACEGRLVTTEAELARMEGRRYEPADKLLERILPKRRARWEATTLTKMIASGKPPKDDNWKRKYKEPSSPATSNLPRLPEGWRWAKLDQMALLQGGITKGQKRKNDGLRTVPYLRVANVQRGFLNLAEISQIEATEAEIDELRLQDGDVFFNEGGDRDKLGRGWVWESQLPECIHQNHVFRARLVTSDLDPYFLSFYSNEFGQGYFFDQGKHTTNLASLSMSKLRELPVPLPPASEQKRIVQYLLRTTDVIERQASTSRLVETRLSRLRQSILSSAFAGKLVLQEPQDEPASVLLGRIRAGRASAADKKASKRSGRELTYV